jgi:hypothetical protein
MSDAVVARTAVPAGSVTLRTFALAAIAEISGDVLSSGSESQFLREQLDQAQGSLWRDALLRYLREPAVIDEPFLALAQAMRLSPSEVLAAALCAAVEEDVMVGRALAYVQAPLGGSRPTVALLSSALAHIGSAAAGSNHLASGPAVESGLLSIIGDTAPLPERAMSIPLHISAALAGRDAAVPGTVIGVDPALAVPLPAGFQRDIRTHAAALIVDPLTPLLIRAASPAEGRTVVGAIANAIGRRPLFINVEKVPGLGPWAILRALLPVYGYQLAPGERKTIPPAAHYRGAVMALCGPDGMVDSAAGPVMSWTLAVPGREERVTLWQRAIGDEALAGTLARNHRHGAGRIFHLGKLARHHAVVRGRSAPTRDDLVDASWSGEGSGLDALAQPMRHRIPDAALVTTPALRAQLELLVSRCRARDGLVDGLGVSLTARYQPGVRALFVGPSGTGKTLAASWLATRLGLPLYRVDLAAVTSKYIGETEKNLAQLLARAEQAEVVLLFDEADSLFGKRTDVRDANDRFANAQTNYLLQRIEYFDGISILTSNSRSRFDDAFSRRLDLVVEFAAPGPDERRDLWLSHLGTHHALEPRDLNQLSALAELSGGEIRNAVLAAAALAQVERRPVEYADLIAGIASEYRKAGRQMPIEIHRRG